MKPLFCPLRKEYYLQFKSGLKTTEYRAYGRGWNEKTCAIGRLINLSLGYNGERLLAEIKNISIVDIADAPQVAIDLYAHRASKIICIDVNLDICKSKF